MDEETFRTTVESWEGRTRTRQSSGLPPTRTGLRKALGFTLALLAAGASASVVGHMEIPEDAPITRYGWGKSAVSAYNSAHETVESSAPYQWVFGE